MRVTFCKEKFGRFTFNIELDTGGTPGEEIVVWVYDKNEAVIQNDMQFRTYFPSNDAIGFTPTDRFFIDDESYDPIEKYCRQFARDKTFRKAELTRFFKEDA